MENNNPIHISEQYFNIMLNHNNRYISRQFID